MEPINLVVILITWVLLSAVVAEFAYRARGRSSGAWLCLSLLLSPLVAFFIAAVLPVETSADNDRFRKCPACAEPVRAEAKICRYCRSSLD